MKKYFVVSDIHSFYKPLITCLENAEFDVNNENHILIVLGDIFDRGPDTIKVFKFLTSLPNDRLILIKGNHEYLYNKLLEKEFPESYDFHNGTVNTFLQIANSKYDVNIFFEMSIIRDIKFEDSDEDLWQYAGEILSGKYYSMILSEWKDICEKVKTSEVTKFIQSERWLDFYELNNYIFTHAFIPIQCIENSRDNTVTNININDWRTNATQTQFENSRWLCPYLLYKQGLFDEEIRNNKILVCGHWRTKDFHENLETIRLNDITDKNDIFISPHLIALDATTIISNKINVLCIDDE